MKSFNKLIGVIVVSATVLLTGCNIEALGNFGKATAVLENYNVVFDNSYNECFVNRNLRYAIEMASEVDLIEEEVILPYALYNNKVYCLEFKKSDREFKKINENFTVMGKMLSKIEEDANISIEDVKGYAAALKTLNEIEIVEPDNNDREKVQLKKIITGLYGETKDNSNKLTGILKSAARGIYKIMAKKKLAQDISNNLKESKVSVLSSVNLLKEVIVYYRLRNIAFEGSLRLAEKTIIRIKTNGKLIKNPDCNPDDLAAKKCTEFIKEPSYNAGPETIKALMETYKEAVTLYGERIEKLDKYESTLDQFLVAYNKLVEMAEDKKNLGKERFDGEKFKTEMLSYLQDALAIFGK